jgi:FSR family fosmidomycin resistance protein-like MFS transporter
VTLQKPEATAFRVLVTISLCHFLNDVIQSVIPSVYPMLKASYHLDFGQVGLITFTFQFTASILQPAVGLYTDSRPTPYSLPLGMAFTLAGILLLATAPAFAVVLVAVALVGMGSAVFHPEASRVARMASGGQHGLAQSLFQVGGNGGSALGPLLVAGFVISGGQRRIAWFSAVAVLAVGILVRIGNWYRLHRPVRRQSSPGRSQTSAVLLPRAKVYRALAVLVVLIFSKYIYLVSLTSYYTFYLIDRFHVSLRTAQVYLFVFLGAVAVGTLIGGPVGDRIGRKYVIWVSILGVLPFTLALPFASLPWTAMLTVIIGLVLASAFSAILVYAQELIPERIGTISGVFFGLAFGVAGCGAALLGQLADAHGIQTVYRICSFLPALGVLTAFLPSVAPQKR